MINAPQIGPGPLHQGDAETINRAIRDLYALRYNFTADQPLEMIEDAGGMRIRLRQNPPVWGRILDGPWGDGAYSWELLEEQTRGTFRVPTVGLSGGDGSLPRSPAYEINGNLFVPAGTIVRLWRGFVNTLDDRGQEWLFEYCCTGDVGSGSSRARSSASSSSASSAASSASSAASSSAASSSASSAASSASSAASSSSNGGGSSGGGGAGSGVASSSGSGSSSGFAGIIDPTVQVGCCPNLLHEVLRLRFSGGTGTCTCLNGEEMLVAWNGIVWTAQKIVCGAPLPIMPTLACDMGGTTCNNFSIAFNFCGRNVISAAPDSCSCEPFQLVFNNYAVALGDCCVGDFDITVDVP